MELQGVDPQRLYRTRDLALLWSRKDVRKFEEQLERRGVPIVRIGNGLALIRGIDLWTTHEKEKAAEKEDPIVTPAAFARPGAAKYLPISTTILDKLTRAGKFKTVIIGGVPRYLRDDLDRFLNEQPKVESSKSCRKSKRKLTPNPLPPPAA